MAREEQQQDDPPPAAPPPPSFDPDEATRRRQIIGLYQQYLKRAPGPSEIDAWMRANLPVQEIEKQIQGSDEYKKRQTGGNTGDLRGRLRAGMSQGDFTQWVNDAFKAQGKQAGQRDYDYWWNKWNEFGANDPGTFYDKFMAPDTGGSGGGNNNGSMSIDPSYLKPFSENFGQAWQELYGSPWDPNANPGDFQAPDPSQIDKDQGYQFRKGQAIGGVQNSAAARGLLNSGGTLYDILGVGDQMASQEYQNAWNRNFATWNQNWQNYGQKYGRAWQQFVEDKDTWYRNQDEPWRKLYDAATLGNNAAGA